MAEMTIAEEDANASDVSDIHVLEEEENLKSPKPSTTHKKAASKATKANKGTPVPDITGNDAKAQKKATKKSAAVSKKNPPTAKKSAAKVKKEPERAENEMPLVSNAEKEKEAVPETAPIKATKKRAGSPINGGAIKRIRVPKDYDRMPDSYEELNEKDKILFDLRRNSRATWDVTAVEYKKKAASNEHKDTIRKRYQNYVEVSGTEFEDKDV